MISGKDYPLHGKGAGKIGISIVPAAARPLIERADASTRAIAPVPCPSSGRRRDGRLLGAQALGEDNVDKRISALAMAIQMGATI